MLMNRIMAGVAVLSIFLTPLGCTTIRQYFHNGLKVGPNYCPPQAMIADHWIDADDKKLNIDEHNFADWWKVLDDPLLNRLMVTAYRQNLTLRQAGFRILAARAQLGIATGQFFPQQQTASGSYFRRGIADNYFDQWSFGFNLAWELDFWGKFRRAIISAEDSLEASIFNYDAALVTLLADTATYYIQIRTTEERIRLLDNIIRIQEDVLNFIDARVKLGKNVTDLDRAQARSNLMQSRASRNQLLIDLRISQNQLCIVLGRPVTDITELLADAPKKTIPTAPQTVVVGIPADLLRRRPDVRQAERQAAAQAEQIGIAETDWYPAIAISGTLGWQAQSLSNLFTPQTLSSSFGPQFNWKLLNYGRILNNVRLQYAQFMQLVTLYQSTVLQADLEVENSIVTFLQAQQRAANLEESVDEAWIALNVIVAQYEAGLQGVDFNRYATIQQTLVSQQDLWVQSRGQIAISLVQIYRGLGGGWEIRLTPQTEESVVLNPTPGDVEQLVPAQPADREDLPPTGAPDLPNTNPPVDQVNPPVPPAPLDPVPVEPSVPNPATPSSTETPSGNTSPLTLATPQANSVPDPIPPPAIPPVPAPTDGTPIVPPDPSGPPKF